MQYEQLLSLSKLSFEYTTTKSDTLPNTGPKDSDNYFSPVGNQQLFQVFKLWVHCFCNCFLCTMNGSQDVSDSLMDQLYAHWGKTMFPDVVLKLAIEGPAIKYFDVFRKKWLILTPEEWVRQHFANWLELEKKLSRGMIRLEHGLIVNQMAKRADVVVYKPNQDILLLAEIKAPYIELNENTVKQMAMYHQKFQADWLAISNGQQSLFWKKQAQTWEMLEIEDFLER